MKYLLIQRNDIDGWFFCGLYNTNEEAIERASKLDMGTNLHFEPRNNPWSDLFDGIPAAWSGHDYYLIIPCEIAP